jgi:SAM-dependent methyltransferase
MPLPLPTKGIRMPTDDGMAARVQYWSGGDYPKLAAALGGNLHIRFMLALGAVQPGTQWLDVATGTGTIALQAARLGASVTAQDLSPRMIELTQANALAAGLSLKLDVGDCERMPYSDGAFDIITSAHGAVFAPDHQAVAGELTRLCRLGGRVAVSAWSPGGGFLELAELEASFAGLGPAAQNSPFNWGDPERVASLLGDAFELEFVTGNSPMRGKTPAAFTQLFWESSPRTAALRARLGPDKELELHAAMLAFFERHNRPGGVFLDRPYLIVVGKRKPS